MHRKTMYDVISSTVCKSTIVSQSGLVVIVFAIESKVRGL
jgi:hypothetical protein